MEMPNSGAVDFGKADNSVEQLPIPEWARNAWSSDPVVILSPLDMAAGSALMGQGYRKVAGKRVWPWQKKKINRGALEMAQGRTGVFNPNGSGRSYS